MESNPLKAMTTFMNGPFILVGYFETVYTTHAMASIDFQIQNW